MPIECTPNRFSLSLLAAIVGFLAFASPRALMAQSAFADVNFNSGTWSVEEAGGLERNTGTSGATCSDKQAMLANRWSFTNNARKGAKAGEVNLERCDFRAEIWYGIQPRFQQYNVPTEMWYGWSLYFPTSFDASSTWSIVSQWHDQQGAVKGQAPTRLFISDNELGFALTYQKNTNLGPLDSGYDPKKDFGERKTILFNALPKGVWIDFVLHVNWSHLPGKGYVELWVRKSTEQSWTKKIDWNQSTYHDLPKGPRFSTGIYRGQSGWPGTAPAKLRVDEVRVKSNDSCFDEVAPGVHGACGPGPAPGGHTAEAGKVTTNAAGNAWTTVALNQTYDTPVVVAGPVSYNGPDPATVRVKDVTSTAFKLQIDEWDYLDMKHTSETIPYLVAEAGVHTLADGSLLQAGRASSVDENWRTVSFNQPFASVPVVLTQCATYNGGAAVATRIRNVTKTSFQVRLQEEEGNDQKHADESVHWIAVSPTSSNLLEAGRTADAVTDAWHQISFDGSYNSGSVFLAAMQTFDGGDASTLRYRNFGSNKADVFVEEERSKDNETGHTTEVVGYLVFGSAGSLGGAVAATYAQKDQPAATHHARPLDERATPDAFRLDPAYPNPFNPETTIRFVLPEATDVRLEVFDAVGRRVAVLADGALAAGTHTATFNAADLPSGLYLYRIQAGAFVERGTMMLVK